MAVKKYRRNLKNKMVSGVLAGVADYYDQDPTLVRVLWLLLMGVTGFLPAILCYAAAAILVPSEKADLKTKRKKI